MTVAETNTPDILLLKAMQPEVMAVLAPRFRLHRLDEAQDKAAFFAQVGPLIRGMAVGAMAPIDRTLLEKLPRLEIVSSFGVGYDTIDVSEAARRGIVVTHTPDVLSDEVADLALGLLLATVREIPKAERHLRAGLWPKGSYRLTASLRERRIGILGLGRIGRAIARRLEGFGVEIAYFGRRKQDVPYTYHASLLEMARAVDTLMIVAPGGPETDRIVDEAVLASLGPEGIVVNVARGSIVDEPALIAALKKGTIRGAGLDVFHGEPNISEDFLTLDNVVLLPHVGSGSVQTRKAMGQLLVDNLLSWFDNKGALTPVPETQMPARRSTLS